MGGNLGLRLLSLLLLLLPSMVVSEVGFRDLKVGGLTNSITKNCEIDSGYLRCYKIDDIAFQFSFKFDEENDDELILTDENNQYRSVGIGFRDVWIGMKRSELENHCWILDQSWWVCYNLMEYFYLKFDDDILSEINVKYKLKNKGTIDSIKVDLGPLYQTILDVVLGDPNNPYMKLKKSLESNYKVDWEFTKRDQKLFNEGEKDSLWISYNGGQIFSQIMREDKNSDLRLWVHYHTKEEGKKLSEERRPQNVNFSDF